MIDVMTRLKVHHLVEGGLPHSTIAEKLGIGLRSVERIASEDAPTPAEIVSGKTAKKRGRPSKTARVEEQVRKLLEDQPEIKPIEVLRLARTWGYDGGRSAMFEMATRLRPPPRPKEPVVLFDGLPGEFAQYDFGEVLLAFADGTRRRVHFFAGRLKYSRFLHIEVVPDQKAESVVRGLLACLVAFGGSPKQWVFDNPRTIRISPMGAPLRLHAFLRELVAEMNVLPEMCAPRAGNQKGSVENLVGFVKNSFFLVRTFEDEADLHRQLADWLHAVNFVRKCDATGEIPEVFRQHEAVWLEKRPVRWTPEDYPIRESRTITPMGTVNFAGTSYSTPPERIGAVATLHVRKDRIDMEVGSTKWSHERKDGLGGVRRLPEHRRAVLAVIHGVRKQRYFRRQCLLEIGPAAEAFLEQLVHRCPGGTWSPHVDHLFDLLLAYGSEDLASAFSACLRSGEFTSEAVARHFRRVA